MVAHGSFDFCLGKVYVTEQFSAVFFLCFGRLAVQNTDNLAAQDKVAALQTASLFCSFSSHIIDQLPVALELTHSFHTSYHGCGRDSSICLNTSRTRNTRLLFFPTTISSSWDGRTAV